MIDAANTKKKVLCGWQVTGSGTNAKGVMRGKKHIGNDLERVFVMLRGIGRLLLEGLNGFQDTGTEGNYPFSFLGKLSQTN